MSHQSFIQLFITELCLSHNIIIMSLKDFQMIQKLGEGAFSTVYRVKRLIDDQQYAMKKVKMDNLSEKEKQNALNEVRVLASITHPNIISYKQAFIEKGTNYLYIIMQYADNGDLLEKIKQHTKKNTYFSQFEVWSIFIQVTQGLKVLHDMRILHRDIKSANVFLKKNGTVKLGDLNVAKRVRSLCQTQTGTPYYASPQIWKDQPYDKKSDIWSLGCVLYEAIALKPPFKASDMQGLYKKVVRGFYTSIPPQYSSQLTIIIKMLLQVTPHLRASCDKILDHPIVIKHTENLPAEYANNPLGKAQLMKTISIDRRDNTDDLSRKVVLPKARYFNTIAIDEFIKMQQSQKKISFLPRLVSTNQRGQENRNEHKKAYSLHKMQKEKIETEDSEEKKVRRRENYEYSRNKQKKGYGGRIKQLSTDIIQKILRQEKQKQKIQSIIGTK